MAATVREHAGDADKCQLLSVSEFVYIYEAGNAEEIVRQRRARIVFA
jgi:hypothetical protein